MGIFFLNFRFILIKIFFYTGDILNISDGHFKKKVIHKTMIRVRYKPISVQSDIKQCFVEQNK